MRSSRSFSACRRSASETHRPSFVSTAAAAAALWLVSACGPAEARHAPGTVIVPEPSVSSLGPEVSVDVLVNPSERYATLLENGVVNIDWLELHNGSFLSERSQRLGPAYKGIQLTSRFVQSGDTFVSSSSSVPYALQAHAATRDDGSVSLLLVNIAPKTVATVNLTFEDGFTKARTERYDYRPTGEAADGLVVGPVDVDPNASLQVDAYSALVLVFRPE